MDVPVINDVVGLIPTLSQYLIPHSPVDGNDGRLFDETVMADKINVSLSALRNERIRLTQTERQNTDLRKIFARFILWILKLEQFVN